MGQYLGLCCLFYTFLVCETFFDSTYQNLLFYSGYDFIVRMEKFFSFLNKEVTGKSSSCAENKLLLKPCQTQLVTLKACNNVT